jgi:hypothetical protein
LDGPEDGLRGDVGLTVLVELLGQSLPTVLLSDPLLKLLIGHNVKIIIFVAIQDLLVGSQLVMTNRDFDLVLAPF